MFRSVTLIVDVVSDDYRSVLLCINSVMHRVAGIKSIFLLSDYEFDHPFLLSLPTFPKSGRTKSRAVLDVVSSLSCSDTCLLVRSTCVMVSDTPLSFFKKPLLPCKGEDFEVSNTKFMLERNGKHYCAYSEKFPFLFDKSKFLYLFEFYDRDFEVSLPSLYFSHFLPVQSFFVLDKPSVWLNVRTVAGLSLVGSAFGFYYDLSYDDLGSSVTSVPQCDYSPVLDKGLVKCIHFVWEGLEGGLPSFVEGNIKTWRDNNPTWEVKIWDAAAIWDFVNSEYPELVENFYNLTYEIERWDCIRYLALYRFGGLYADVDTECFESLDSLIEGKLSEGYSCVFMQDIPKVPKAIAPSIFYSQPGACFVGMLIEHVLKSGFAVSDFTLTRPVWVLTKTTGPESITNLFYRGDFEGSVCVLDFDIVMICKLPEGVRRDNIHELLPSKEAEFLSGYKEGVTVAGHYFYHSWLFSYA